MYKVIHSIGTISNLCELSDIVKQSGNEWALRLIHEELAKRLAFLSNKRPRQYWAKRHASMLNKDFKELRMSSKKYEERCERVGFVRSTVFEKCFMCAISPLLPQSMTFA